MVRKIIKIDEEKCNGCGACAMACHEGAIEMVNGKVLGFVMNGVVSKNKKTYYASGKYGYGYGYGYGYSYNYTDKTTKKN